MKLILFAATMSILFLSSCQSGNKEEKYVFKDTTGLTPTVNAPTVVPAQDPATLSNGIQTIQPVNGQQPTTPATMDAAAMQKIMESMKANPTVTTTPAPNTTTTAPGMNPPHGQPGHRCDISVGAPLDSKPAQPVVTQNAQPQPAPVVTQQPTAVVTPQPTNTQPTAPGMNPPHGQPGHRCDINVGAPLNSKPVTPQPQATVTTEQNSKVPKKDSLK